MRRGIVVVGVLVVVVSLVVAVALVVRVSSDSPSPARVVSTPVASGFKVVPTRNKSDQSANLGTGTPPVAPRGFRVAREAEVRREALEVLALIAQGSASGASVHLGGSLAASITATGVSCPESRVVSVTRLLDWWTIETSCWQLRAYNARDGSLVWIDAS
jgi:hypothetical protein